MLEPKNNAQLPAIPGKRYFTIGEVSELCGVKPHVLRYWEQEFPQLKPVKRRGNRRYYQHHEVLLVRRIRELLYEQGFTINGARNRLDENERSPRAQARQRRRRTKAERRFGAGVAEPLLRPRDGSHWFLPSPERAANSWGLNGLPPPLPRRARGCPTREGPCQS